MATRRGSNSNNKRQLIFQEAGKAINQLLLQNRARRADEEKQQRLFEQQRQLEEQRHQNDLNERSAANEFDMSKLLKADELKVAGEERVRTEQAPEKLLDFATQAKTLNEVPTETAVVNRARASSALPESKYFGKSFNPPSVNGQPQVAMPIPQPGSPSRLAQTATGVQEVGGAPAEQPDVVTQALQARNTIAQHLKQLDEQRQAEAFGKTPRLGPGNVMGITNPTDQSFAPTERTGVQEGQKESDKITQAIRAKAQEAYAVTYNQELAKSKFPDPSKAGGAGTDASRRIATIAAQMLASHAQAKLLEDQGRAELKPGVGTAARSPGMLAAVQKTPFAYSEDSLGYNQAAQSFTNLEGLRLSGVTVREDERDSFLTTMFAVQGEPDSTRKAKQQYRQNILAALQLSIGGSKEAAGEVIGKSVRQGTLPPQVLAMIDWDPEILKGIVKYVPVK